jgi:hypothetical protein
MSFNNLQDNGGSLSPSKHVIPQNQRGIAKRIAFANSITEYEGVQYRQEP